ncbi:hypothetical protein BG011_006265 [Mortierella polycephala]|uniref:Thioesterase domain-containing protein n=1 Tax=Mortierella polycephala TaxID=41804 RepID=A0A9P6QB52_9FUNG|nr:hypothetical protein BG011_006265 [Mortierella polycephala]
MVPVSYLQATNEHHVFRTTFLNAGGFDIQALSGLKLISASKGSILCELQVEKQHLVRGCHGGLLSTIVDVGGSLAIAAEDMHSTGVSTDLNVSFISGAKIGDKLTIASAFYIQRQRRICGLTSDQLASNMI